MYKLSDKSLSKLSECHPDLQEVVKLAITICKYDFGVNEAERSLEIQELYVSTGSSTTLRSRHIKREQDKDGVHAVDLFAWGGGRVSWEMRHYKKIAKAMFKAAIILGVDIEWGGLWENPEDGPHFQLSWATYP